MTGWDFHLHSLLGRRATRKIPSKNPSTSLAADANNTVCASFEFRDRFVVTHQVVLVQTHVSFLTIADGKSHEQADAWVKPLKAHYPCQVELLGIAAFSAVPGFI